jgi:2-C-methyl-D-erythritol 4-phosphate cytidylyltransferase / 2-C-methyl-D-erythritol 2,4-cyclodiphosphate synthase
MMKATAAVIIPAAGFGTRMQLDHPKQFHLLAGVPILIHTVRAFLGNPQIGRCIVVVPGDWIDRTHDLFRRYGLARSSLSVTAGGRRRQDSVQAGLVLLDEGTDIVLVHDGARPLVSRELIDRCCLAARQHGAAIAAVPVKDTLKKAADDLTVAATVDRQGLWQAQTPQAMRLSMLQRAYRESDGSDVTDEASLLEQAGIPVSLVEGEETNLKITRPEDLRLAEDIMRRNLPTPRFRIGHGFDAHRFAAGRDLVLGGVTIPHHLGLAGHSDADVLTHALCDALLGAIGARDIGYHFPDSDAHFSGVYSITLLEKVIDLVEQKGLCLANADITVICQAPRLADHIPTMQDILAKACRTDAGSLNVKATTTEKMGYTGREEGISCHAVVLLETRHNYQGHPDDSTY